MIRVGLLGAGNISRRHVTALGQLRARAELVAVCDLAAERAEAVAAATGAHAHRSLDEMLARERIDALYVCLPPDAHGDQELAAIGRGIHLFVEKPLPLDLALAERIADAAQAAGIATAVGYHWRHFSQTQELRRRLEGERVGMAIGSFLNLLPGSPWWRVKARSGGQVVEQAIHVFDTSRHVLGEVELVWAQYALRANHDEPGFDQEDVYTVNLRFRSGALGAYQACCMLHRRYRVGLELLCKGRAYRLTERELEVDDANGVRTVPIENDPALDENAAFLDAVEHGVSAPALCDYADALATQRVVMAANRSAETSQPVALA